MIKKSDVPMILNRDTIFDETIMDIVPIFNLKPLPGHPLLRLFVVHCTVYKKINITYVS